MYPPSRTCIALMALFAASCTTIDKDAPRPTVTVDPPTKTDIWMDLASAPDKLRLQNIATGWSGGLAEARKAGNGGDIRAEGKLLDPDAGLERPAPTPGSYNCRMITLGREGKKGPAYQKFKPFFCFVQADHDLFAIVKQTGSKRPAGRLWEDDDSKRLIFLGTLALGNEEEAKPYGEDARRDMAGVFERIGPFRWRLVIPYPTTGAKIDVFELTPVDDQPGE